jgi:hypothetical protein
MSETSVLRPEDQEHLDELIGKYVFDGGMSRIEAEDRALREILEARQKEAGGKKKAPFRFLRIGDLELTPPRWLVKNLIEADGFGEIFGEPGCGKSFLGIELACRVATGTPFFGFEVKSPGPVYYLAAEGRGGLLRRFKAWSIARGTALEGTPLFLNETPLVLIDESSCRNAISALEKKAAELKTPPALIILDTWSRNLGGDDSSPQDAAIGVSALDQIRSHFQNVACLVIHHSGQNVKDRSRGWSGLRAAVDFEFRMERGSDDLIRLACTKNKEAELPEPMAFKMVSIDLGINDEEGKPVYSAVLSEIDYVDDPGQRKSCPGKNQTLAVELLQKTLGEYTPVPGTPPGVPLALWRDKCWAALGNKNRFYDIRDSLVRRGRIQIREEYVSFT